MKGLLIYKCRLCGSEHRPTRVPSILDAMVRALNGIAIPKSWEGGRYIKHLELHVCSDGRFGVSDLVGGEISLPEKEVCLTDG